MKKITKQVPIYKTVQHGTADVHTYITEDGVEFAKESDAIKHEQDLKFKKIEKKYVANLLGEFDEWYNPKDEEELEILKRRLGFYDMFDTINVSGELKPLVWISTKWESGGDYNKDITTFVTLDYLEEEVLNLGKTLRGE